MRKLEKSQELIHNGDLALFGCPVDENSSFLTGPCLAPPLIRDAFHSPSANYCAENGMDLGKEERLVDAGDIRFKETGDKFTQIEEFAEKILEAGGIPFCLGGDHSITFPLIKAVSKKHPAINILHLDAHPDLYDEFEGNRFSHACPFARIMEEGLAGDLLQVGIRTLVPHQRAQAKRFGVRIIEARNFSVQTKCDLTGPIYISLDMDVFDPAFAPGVSHHEPGGLSSREVLNFIQRIDVPIIGADIVEFNPKRDPSGITAMLAGKLLKEILAQILENNALI